MTQRLRQQVFLEVAQRLAVLDGPTLTRLLHAVPEPEQAIQYLLDKQLIGESKASELQAGYRAGSADIAAGETLPVSSGLPSPPPRPGAAPTVPSRPATTGQPASRSPERQKPEPDTSGVDAFDALIDDILND